MTLKRARAEFVRTREKLSIRCVDCLATFCRACARKHFAPIQRAERALDKTLERLAVAAMKKVRCS